MRPVGTVELSAERAGEMDDDDDIEPISSSSLTGTYIYFFIALTEQSIRKYNIPKEG